MKNIVLFIIMSLPVASFAFEPPHTNKKVSKAFVQNIKKLQAEGRKMELLRSSLTQANSDACMEKMNQFLPLAKKLRKEGEALPMTSANISFKTASTHLTLCVTCASIAAQQCEMVESSIQDGLKFLREE